MSVMPFSRSALETFGFASVIAYSNCWGGSMVAWVARDGQ